MLYTQKAMLEYADVDWYPITAEGISKLERVQKLAGRFITTILDIIFLRQIYLQRLAYNPWISKLS